MDARIRGHDDNNIFSVVIHTKIINKKGRIKRPKNRLTGE